MEFNIEVKYNDIIYVKVSEVLENNKKLGYTKKSFERIIRFKKYNNKRHGQN